MRIPLLLLLPAAIAAQPAPKDTIGSIQRMTEVAAPMPTQP